MLSVCLTLCNITSKLSLKRLKLCHHVNQILLAPGCAQEDLVAYCQERDILLEAYSPLGTGSIFGNEEVEAVAERNGKSVAQVCLTLEPSKKVSCHYLSQWHQKNIEANLDIFDFDLSEEDMAVLDKIQGIKTQDDPEQS